ncbi:MAG: hypothetical protein R3C13_07025 [Hyphomonas sp.]|uniref:hypothetical protein n=1 Tax=Hyphomonas sp. TaxID=87 RepID=UPI003528CCAE
MSNQKKPILRLKGYEVVPPDEDRLVDVGVYDALLPCRKFEISYRVAVLGNVSPSLEFLLRLVKAVPGISVEEAAAFFGYSQKEMEYVLEEAREPAYVALDQERLRLTIAGEQLFKDSGNEPLIYSVENRRRSYGFDLLSVAPQRPISLDPAEFDLPELPIEDPSSTGNVANRLSNQFRRFFHELSDKKDREQVQRQDLYSIDNIAAKERFQIPVRIVARAQASSPHLIEEVDLTGWRPDHELVDRREVERAASLFLELTKSSTNQLKSEDGYRALVELAPDFLKEYSLRDGLSVRRYWREAVGRTGEVRSDRKTIALVGNLTLQSNIEKLSSVLEYGQRDKQEIPRIIISVTPQIAHWAATTYYRDLLSLVRKKIERDDVDTERIKAIGLTHGKPARYLQRMLDSVASSDQSAFPPALELFFVPQTFVAALVHAPIGATNGYPVPLGFASFDDAVLSRTNAFVLDQLGRFDMNDALYNELAGTLADAPTETKG